MRRSLCCVCLVLVGSAAIAADKKPLTAAEMKELLGNGLAVTSTDTQGGKSFVGKVKYVPDGTLVGTLTFTGGQPIDLAGTWKLDGARLCRTITPLQPQEVCETWVRSGDKEITIRVGASEIAVSRWD